MLWNPRDVHAARPFANFDCSLADAVGRKNMRTTCRYHDVLLTVTGSLCRMPRVGVSSTSPSGNSKPRNPVADKQNRTPRQTDLGEACHPFKGNALLANPLAVITCYYSKDVEPMVRLCQCTGEKVHAYPSVEWHALDRQPCQRPTALTLPITAGILTRL